LEWLNYHHLLYFYLVAREGTIAKAGKILRLSQPTISGQIRSLEDALGEKLFVRVGRTLQLTDVGRIVYRYADEIFSIGRELQDTLKGRPTGRPLRLHVGISDVVPKLIAYRLLEPALRMGSVQMVCTEDKTDRLLAELSIQSLDLVIADAPVGANVSVRAYNHLLGETGVTFFGRESLRESLQGEFPKCLEGAPMLLPTENTVLRRTLDRWFEQIGVRPKVVAEFEDSALMKVFGERGEGVFPAPTVIEREIRAHYSVVVVGRAEELRERFYAITVERRIKHPAVMRISEGARSKLFG
jgi:LysR family transcriptional regulator, transcriptional activator of nhaA